MKQFFKARWKRYQPFMFKRDVLHMSSRVYMIKSPQSRGGVLLLQVRELENPGYVYQQCMDLMARLASKGLIHCDFNEFNLLVSQSPTLII